MIDPIMYSILQHITFLSAFLFVVGEKGIVNISELTSDQFIFRENGFGGLDDSGYADRYEMKRTPQSLDKAPILNPTDIPIRTEETMPLFRSEDNRYFVFSRKEQALFELLKVNALKVWHSLIINKQIPKSLTLIELDHYNINQQGRGFSSDQKSGLIYTDQWNLFMRDEHKPDTFYVLNTLYNLEAHRLYREDLPRGDLLPSSASHLRAVRDKPILSTLTPVRRPTLATTEEYKKISATNLNMLSNFLFKGMNAMEPMVYQQKFVQ